MSNLSKTNMVQSKSKGSIQETLELVIVGALAKGRSVIIPDFGYLELKSFADRCTVLFKATSVSNSIPNPFPNALDVKDADYFLLLSNGISKPLKDGKIVSIPNLGIFRPLQKEDGSFHVSFTPSSFLRKRLSEAPVSEKKVEQKPTIGVEQKSATEIEQKPTTEIEQQKPSPQIDKKEMSIIGEVRELLTATEERTKNIQREEDIFGFENDTMLAERSANKGVVFEKERKGSLPIEEKEANNTKIKERIIKKNLGTFILIFTFLLAILVVIAVILSQKKDEAQFSTAAPKATSINLMDLAKEHYGNSAFWVYIYECNQDLIKSPVNIPRGVQITIPDLSLPEYNIDINDSEEIIRARLRSESILQKLKQ